MDKHELPPCVDRYAIIRLETLSIRRASSLKFIFELLSSRMNSPSMLSLVKVNALQYHTWRGDFLRVDFHHTIYQIHEPLNSVV
jgi:hypothetical protein